jgi:hypothetical protein
MDVSSQPSGEGLRPKGLCPPYPPPRDFPAKAVS